ncbi:MAG: ankyrin repeat protein [Candidatus Omnitrophota bacterium]|jgi:ankyrin repeat protein
MEHRSVPRLGLYGAVLHATLILTHAQITPDGSTPLHQAAYQDQVDTALDLLKSGALPDVKNTYGITPLMLACENGNGPLVEHLLKAGANPNDTRRGGESVLMLAARTGLPGPVQALIAKGAKLDATNHTGQTALMWAAAEGHAPIVKILLDAGADPDRKLKSGFTALYFAAREGHGEVIQVLEAAGVDIHASLQTEHGGGRAPGAGISALMFAIENGHFELAAQLLEAGADPDDQRSGTSPLHMLTWVRKPNRGDGLDGAPPPNGSGEMSSLSFAELLLQKGAKVNAPLKHGKSSRLSLKGATPFLMAAKTADLSYLKLLKKHGADPLRPNAEGTTPLMAAAGLGTHAPTEEAGTEAECLEVVAWLLTLGAEVNTTDQNGETAMHGAAYKSLPAMVHFLDEHGADIQVWNRKNKQGWTPLLMAQGFRPGNFKPAPATIEAISSVMRKHDVTPPPPPARPVVGKPKKYEP